MRLCSADAGRPCSCTPILTISHDKFEIPCSLFFKHCLETWNQLGFTTTAKKRGVNRVFCHFVPRFSCPSWLPLFFFPMTTGRSAGRHGSAKNGLMALTRVVPSSVFLTSCVHVPRGRTVVYTFWWCSELCWTFLLWCKSCRLAAKKTRLTRKEKINRLIYSWGGGEPTHHFPSVFHEKVEGITGGYFYLVLENVAVV